MRVQWKVAVALCCLFALLDSHDAWSYSGTSGLSYSTGSEWLSGYSATFADYWDPPYTYDCWWYEYDDWYGIVCISWRVASRQVYVATNAYPLGAGPPQFSAEMYGWTSATAGFVGSVSPNNHDWRGTWTDYGNHYMVEDYVDWFCGSVNYCYPVYAGRNWYYLGTTSATAQVPYCIHHGTPASGSQSGDESLWDNGSGYYHYLGTDAPDTDDWACPVYAQQKVSSLGLWWNQSPMIGIGDLSLQHGGPWVDHSAHQNGLDVDVRYVRNDGVEGPLSFNSNPSQYDHDKTQSLVQQFCLLGGASVIFVHSRANISATCTQVENTEHFNHFHVRFPDPDGTSN